MCEEIEVNGLKIAIRWKKVKRLSLTIKAPDARMTVSAPASLSIKSIKSFILQKMDWIIRNRNEILEKAEIKKAEGLHKDFIYLWGKLYKSFLHADSPCNFIRLEDDGLHIYLKSDACEDSLDRMLLDWYKKELEEVCAERIRYWADRLSLGEISFSLRKMKSRWGSCNPVRKKIVINTELAQKDPACLNYVVAHEATHFFVPNHGEKFKKFMDDILPDWRETKKLLNESD